MNNRTLFGVLSILFNSIGVPSFMNGYILQGVLRIVLSLCTLNIGAIIFFIIGLINGIKILQMSDAEFEAQKANFGAKLFG